MQDRLDRVGHAAPLVRRHVLRLRPAGGTASPRPRGGTYWWDHDATSSRWYTSQTIYDDSFVFVIILRAKAPSLVTYEEAGNFVIEGACFVTKFVSVTTESSLMNTFLVGLYLIKAVESLSIRPRNWRGLEILLLSVG